ncbi:MAG: chitinase [Epulopiscium sp. Nele67-Bin005]|nr:MAG: chitinase [Epulopiscium sp. Nele67-Bin005]
MRTQMHNQANQPYNSNCPNVDRVVGEYVLGDPKNVDPFLLDFVIYAFALIKEDGSLQVYSETHLQQLANLRYANPNLKVIMAIGGWAADGFSDAALTPESRYKFAREVQSWVKEFSLDGIDLDWEYPGSSVSGIKSRPEDTPNFTLMIEALRQVLGQNAWISVAGTGDNSYIRNVQIAQIAPFIDYFNIMSYDFTAGNTGETGNRHQANLYRSDLGLYNISVNDYVQNLINAGMPPEKLLMGIGFYGRRGATVTETFDEIRRDFLNRNGYVVRWDNVAKAPYIVDGSGNFHLSFDNELSIYFKGQYVIDNCLGGMFSWQSNFDNANILASAMTDAINNPQKLETILAKDYL